MTSSAVAVPVMSSMPSSSLPVFSGPALWAIMAVVMLVTVLMAMTMTRAPASAPTLASSAPSSASSSAPPLGKTVLAFVIPQHLQDHLESLRFLTESVSFSTLHILAVFDIELGRLNRKWRVGDVENRSLNLVHFSIGIFFVGSSSIVS